MPRCTLTDVAKAAGVSTKTVSRVVNNESHVGDATRARVLLAINELGYRPNILARSLVHQCSRTIGVLIGDEPGVTFANPYYAEVLGGAGKEAQEAGYQLLLLSSDRIEATQSLINGGCVDGVIVMNLGVSAPQVESLIQAHVPVEHLT